MKMAFVVPGQFGQEARKLLKGRFELRRGDASGNFDEMVGDAERVHFEMMDSDLLWVSMGPEKSNKGRVTMWIRAVKGRLQITVSDDE